MLSVKGLRSSYGRIEVLHGVDLEVEAGEIVALVGANGAGKTTLLRALSGLQPITAGSVSLDGAAIDRMSSYRRVGLGIIQVPEGRQIFSPLTVEDNLRVGAWTRGDDYDADIAHIMKTFPALEASRSRPAGMLSGGQQQMLAIGRALMSKPRLLLLDEPSMGLAPILVEQIYAIISGIREQGVTVLIVEQNVQAALSIADRGYVLESGNIVLEGRGRDLLADRRVRDSYLGVAADAH